mmetsp:Transcript_22565/g.52302  ORF Transcript_22565/g.52302 Transcript_22565/m.52302 type:complete len:270 (-) Transcript_22565:355-1164(-)
MSTSSFAYPASPDISTSQVRPVYCLFVSSAHSSLSFSNKLFAALARCRTATPLSSLPSLPPPPLARFLLISTSDRSATCAIFDTSSCIFDKLPSSPSAASGDPITRGSSSSVSHLERGLTILSPVSAPRLTLPRQHGEMANGTPRSTAAAIAWSDAEPHAWRLMATSIGPSYDSIRPTTISRLVRPTSSARSLNTSSARGLMSSATKSTLGKRYDRARTRLPDPHPKSTMVNRRSWASWQPANKIFRMATKFSICVLFLRPRGVNSPPL